MNKLILLFIFIVSIHYANAQGIDMSKNQSEMQSGLVELKKQISDLEAEIKETENSDPAEAASMKNQLAALKNMVKMLDKTSNPATQPSKSQATNISLPKATASPLVPVKLKQPVIIPTEAEAKDRLLWYAGKKYNDSTLVTTKGMVVQYLKKENKIALQPQKKTDPFDKIVQEYEKGEQRKTEMADKFDKMKNGFMYYPELKNGLALFDEITLMFKDVLKNTVELPVVPMPVSSSGNAAPGKSGGGPNVDLYSNDDISEQFDNEQLLKEMEPKWAMELELAKKMIKDLPPVTEFPEPPLHELGICNLCDTSLIRKQEIQDAIWFDNYWGKELKIIQKITGVERQKRILGYPGGDLSSVFDIIFKRGAEKSKILYDRYGHDIRYMDNVSKAILGYERQVQLLGGSIEGDDSFSGMKLIVNGFKLYDKYLDEQIEAKNYDFVLNIASHLSQERMKQLLGASESAGSDINSVLEKVLKFNRFALTIDLDFILEQLNNKGDLQFKATGAISSKDKIYGMLVPDSCSFKMIQYNTDVSNEKLDDISIPFLVKSGNKTIRNEEDKLEDFHYTGPQSFQLLFPDFKINFCSNNRSDSVFFATLVGDENAATMYQKDLKGDNKNYKTEFLGFANLVLQNADVDQNKSELENIGTDMMNTIGSFQNRNSGGSTLDKLKMQYDGKRKMDAYKKNIQKLSTDKKSIFLFSANNRSTVLVDKFSDTKRKLDDDYNLTRGLIHLRVINDPVK